MKAARIHAYGHSDQIDLEDVPMPDQGPGEVLVRILAAGVNPVDWKIREGYLAKAAPKQLPITLGQDFCGEVLAIGEDVRNVEASDTVYGFANGAYAEYAVLSPDMLASKPRTVDDVTAAALPTPGLTALQLVRIIDPRPGQLILIHGAAGGVGSIATQLCLAKRARVIASAAGHDAPYLTSLGVAQVIDYKTQRFEEHVQDVDAVIDLVGGEVTARSIGVARRGGMIVTTVGPVDHTAAQAHEVRAIALLMKKGRQDLEELAELVDHGTIVPRHARVLPLAQVREAQDLAEHGEPDKLVLRTV